jgi:type I restriction enzyme S subunit
MSDVQEKSMGIKNVIQREFTSGSKFKNDDTLLARITPCLENGKTAFVNCLDDNEVAFGSTEFIVMRAKENISPYWIYCLARDEYFRSHAISSMVGSSGRQRVHSDYLKEFTIPKIDFEIMRKFHRMADPVFNSVKLKTIENNNLLKMKDLLLSKLATVN